MIAASLLALAIPALAGNSRIHLEEKTVPDMHSTLSDLINLPLITESNWFLLDISKLIERPSHLELEYYKQLSLLEHPSHPKKLR